MLPGEVMDPFVMMTLMVMTTIEMKMRMTMAVMTTIEMKMMKMRTLKMRMTMMVITTIEMRMMMMMVVMMKMWMGMMVMPTIELKMMMKRRGLLHLMSEMKRQMTIYEHHHRYTGRVSNHTRGRWFHSRWSDDFVPSPSWTWLALGYSLAPRLPLPLHC